MPNLKEGAPSAAAAANPNWQKKIKDKPAKKFKKKAANPNRQKTSLLQFVLSAFKDNLLLKLEHLKYPQKIPKPFKRRQNLVEWEESLLAGGVSEWTNSIIGCDQARVG